MRTSTRWLYPAALLVLAACRPHASQGETGGQGGVSSSPSATSSGAGGAGQGGAGATGGGGQGGGTGGGGGIGPVNVCGMLTVPPAQPDQFLDLGHSDLVDKVMLSGDRALSYAKKPNKRWILWDTVARAEVESGMPAGDVEIKGQTALIAKDPVGTSFDLRSAADGTLTATISVAHQQVHLAADGSYAWARTSSGISVWSAAGVHLLDWPAASVGAVWAAPGELRVAGGPAGPNVVEIVPVDGSPTTKLPPFSGGFGAWFEDGENFLTTVGGTTVWVYGKDGIQKELVQIDNVWNLGGTKDYFWTYTGAGYKLQVYKVGGGNQPVAQYTYGPFTTLYPSESALGVIQSGYASFDAIQLTGNVDHQTVKVPAAYLESLSLDANGHAVVSNRYGDVYALGNSVDPQAKGFLGCGQAIALSGSASGRVAIATTSARILVFDAAPGGPALTAVIPYNSSHIKLSLDGKVLAAAHTDYGAQYLPDTSLRAFSLPGGNQIGIWDPLALMVPFSFRHFDMSLGGTAISLFTQTPGDLTIITNITNTTTLFQDTTHHSIPVLSPNGAAFVLSDDTPWASVSPCGAAGFYQGSTLINAAAGCAIGWIDDNRVLIQTFKPLGVYDKTMIHDAQGMLLSSPPLPGLRNGFETVTPTSIHPIQTNKNEILDVNTGAVLKTLPGDGFFATIAGAYNVYPCGEGVCATPY